jgi:hypothetical protein
MRTIFLRLRRAHFDRYCAARLSRRPILERLDDRCLLDAGMGCVQAKLISDVPGFAPNTLRNLVNPWGFSENPAGQFRVAANGSGRGVLLDAQGEKSGADYELLTIQPAVGGSDRQEILRRIAFEEPAPPRRINPEVPYELETILFKSISKEPEMRYATAQDLADDLARFLEHKPIQAKRPNLWEHIAKWGRRHPSVLISSLVILLLAVVGLAAGMILIGRERAKAQAQQRRAETHLRQAREAVDQMLTEVREETLARVPQMEPVRRALLEKALGFYEKFLTQESDDPAIRLEAGRAFRRAGAIRLSLGQYDRASEAFRISIELLRGLVASQHSNLDYQRELAESHVALGLLLLQLGKMTDTESE